MLQSSTHWLARGAKLAALASLVTLAACERPPMQSEQSGYRGTGMVQVVNPRTLDDRAAANTVPMATPMAPAAGPKASEIYQNVQVLGDLSVGQFTRWWPLPAGLHRKRVATTVITRRIWPTTASTPRWCRGA